MDCGEDKGTVNPEGATQRTLAWLGHGGFPRAQRRPVKAAGPIPPHSWEGNPFRRGGAWSEPGWQGAVSQARKGHHTCRSVWPPVGSLLPESRQGEDTADTGWRLITTKAHQSRGQTSAHPALLPSKAQARVWAGKEGEAKESSPAGVKCSQPGSGKML